MHLPPALIKFYVDVESTGASNEFFDKFSIRYHISVILKILWKGDNTHRQAIKSMSNELGPMSQFIRFINMLLNDTTYLLDESIDLLKSINETQTAISNTIEWDKQPPELQRSRYYT